MKQCTRSRHLAYTALTGCLSLLLVGGLAEAFLRLRWVPPSERSTQSFGPHEVYGSAPLPGVFGRHVTTEYDVSFSQNRLGFRGPLPTLPSSSDVPRVLVLGDSQTYGLGVGDDETFAVELVKSLSTAERHVEVLNGSCNGWGTRNELAVLDTLGARWKPDVTLVVFFWNDLEDNHRRPTPRFARSASGRVERLDDVPPNFDPLTLRDIATPTRKTPKGLRLGRFLKEGLRGARYRLLGIKKRKISTPEALDAAWATTRELLELTRDRAHEIGTDLVIVALPNQTQVDPAAVIKNIDPLNYDVQERLFAECQALGIETLDLLPALREASDSTDEPLYYYADRHLTARGHAVVGRAISEHLSQRAATRMATAPR